MERKHVNFLVVYLVTIFAIVSILDATPTIPVPDVKFKLTSKTFTVGKKSLVDVTCDASINPNKFAGWNPVVTFYHNNNTLGEYRSAGTEPDKLTYNWVTLNFTPGLNILGNNSFVTYPNFLVTLQPYTEEAKGNYRCSITVNLTKEASARYYSAEWNSSDAPSGGDNDGKSIPWGWWFFFLFLLLSAVVGAYWLKTRYYPSRPVTGLASSGGGGNQSYENMS